MAVTKKVEKKSSPSAAKKAPKKRTAKRMSLTRHKPSDLLSDYAILIYGEQGIGKTTLINTFPKVYSFMFDPNDSYAYYMDTCSNWIDFKDIQNQFMSIEHNFKAAHIDNALVAYEYALDYACEKFGFDHPGGQNDYGASWNKVKRVFIPPLREILLSKYGFLVSCHVAEKDFTTLSGQKYNKIAPDLPKQAYQFLTSQIYNIWYYHYVGDERWLQIVGDEHIVAKNRMKGHFTTKKGEPIHKIPMGRSEDEAFENLMKAFNNEQMEAYRPTFKEKKQSEFKKKPVAKKMAKTKR